MVHWTKQEEGLCNVECFSLALYSSALMWRCISIGKVTLLLGNQHISREIAPCVSVTPVGAEFPQPGSPRPGVVLLTSALLQYELPRRRSQILLLWYIFFFICLPFSFLIYQPMLLKFNFARCADLNLPCFRSVCIDTAPVWYCCTHRRWRWCFGEKRKLWRLCSKSAQTILKSRKFNFGQNFVQEESR